MKNLIKLGLSINSPITSLENLSRKTVDHHGPHWFMCWNLSNRNGNKSRYKILYTIKWSRFKFIIHSQHFVILYVMMILIRLLPEAKNEGLKPLFIIVNRSIIRTIESIVADENIIWDFYSSYCLTWFFFLTATRLCSWFLLWTEIDRALVHSIFSTFFLINFSFVFYIIIYAKFWEKNNIRLNKTRNFFIYKNAFIEYIQYKLGKPFMMKYLIKYMIHPVCCWERDWNIACCIDLAWDSCIITWSSAKSMLFSDTQFFWKNADYTFFYTFAS